VPGFDLNEVVSVFIGGFAQLQRLNGPVDDLEALGIRYLAFERGRRLGPITHEFFPRGSSTVTMLDLARSVAPHTPHMISLLSQDGEIEISAYLAAGYLHWGNETIMVRELDEPITPIPDVRVREIDDPQIAEAVVDAQRAAGLAGHPNSEAHLNDASLIQRWVEVDGDIAAFGRIALIGDSAYLADVVTLPSFRCRGYAGALARNLLDAARMTGSRRCVLTSTEAGISLYRGLGFVDAVPLVGFQLTP
jgi:ribosomal protein S18 acetylase RimI-like enzyme